MRAPIIGTTADEILNGTRNFDAIDGGAGNDTIRGFEARDTLMGGEGDDVIFTGAGPDVSDGGPGDDFIFDGWTNGGAEVMRGGEGDDTLRSSDAVAELGPFANRTDTWMFGEEGEDFLFAGNGRAFLYGGAGDDRIILPLAGGGEAFGGAGDDVIMASPGDTINDIEFPFSDGRNSLGGSNRMDGGEGNDVLVGHTLMNDTFVFAPDGGRDVIRNLAASIFGAEDVIDLTAFNFDMSAEEVVARFGTDYGDRFVLYFDAHTQLVIRDTPYGGGPYFVGDLDADIIAGAILV